MKSLELHIIQSFPSSCLNRDNVGSPKTAFFGGTQRARISSQCYKRAVREFASKELPKWYNGCRTRFLRELIITELLSNKLTNEDAAKEADYIVSLFVGEKKEKDSKKTTQNNSEKKKVKEGSDVLIYSSPSEIKELTGFLSTKYYSLTESEKNETRKEIAKKCKNLLGGCAIDIKLFGRMLAHDPSLNVEAAASFNQVISTHAVKREVDYFTAVEELNSSEDQGAAMIGNVEFNSATMYRYAHVNLDLLFSDQFANIPEDDKEAILKTFITSFALAIPKAKRNSMNADTRPVEIIGIVRDKGHPLQASNAFESPIKPSSEGFIQPSVKALNEYIDYELIKWSDSPSLVCKFTESPTFETFTSNLINHVKSIGI